MSRGKALALALLQLVLMTAVVVGLLSLAVWLDGVFPPHGGLLVIGPALAWVVWDFYKDNRKRA